MMTVCACLWLGLFPLLQFGTYTTITYNKWTIMLLMVCFSLLCVIRRKKPEKRTVHPSVPIAAALAFWIILSCLFSPYSMQVWGIGASYRLEGLATQLCYLGLFFMFSSSGIRRRPVVISAAAGVGVFFAIVMLQRAGTNPLGLYPRGRSFVNAPDFQGTIGNIDMDTGYLCMMAGLFVSEFMRVLFSLGEAVLLRFRLRHAPDSPGQSPAYYALGKRPSRASFSGTRTETSGPEAPSRLMLRLLCLLLLLAAAGLTVFLIVTMGVQFGMITLAVLALVILLRLVPREWRLLLLAILLALALTAVWFWPGESGGLWELKEILHGRAKLSFGSNRLAVWSYSLKLAPEQLLFGSGPDTFTIRFNKFIAENGLLIPTRQGKVYLPNVFDNPHNEYIAHLINHGLPAMLLFAALILTAAFRRRKPPEIKEQRTRLADRIRAFSPWQAAVLCYAVQAFFSFSVCLVAPMFWVVAGICVSDAD